jgi:hypothetical protein
MWEGTTLRVMVADRPYGKFYDFYSVNLEYVHHMLLIKFLELYTLLQSGMDIPFLESSISFLSEKALADSSLDARRFVGRPNTRHCCPLL